MPSPIAHAATGYLIYRLYPPRLPRQGLHQVGPVPYPLLVTVGLSMLPDLDGVFGILIGDFGRVHNNFSHSLFFGFVVALGIGGVAWLKQPADYWHWVALALLCYQLHIIMDFFTVGRGVMLFWPLSSARYQPPVYLFYGLHWSRGWASVTHVWTVATELGYVVLVGLMTRVLSLRVPFRERRR
jgi:inner membrane protein